MRDARSSPSFLLSTILQALLLLGILGLSDAVDADDPYDLSFFTKGAAIGDSYAAGIGAGQELHWACSRYDGSYSNLVALQLGVDPKNLDFTYTACSGAWIKDVKAQAKALSTNQEFIIVSAGGNDADLVGILNSCVFSFYESFKHPNCDKKLVESGDKIKSSSFASSVDDLIATAKSKLANGGNIYYVGYAKFFDTTDNACDKVSWHIWLNLFTTEYLTQSRRRGMNYLVDLMNEALRAAVARAGDNVHFIDYDQYVDLTNGRYCQPGVDENVESSANRRDIFFYKMQSKDFAWLHEYVDAHDELKKRDNSFNDDGDIQPANNTLNALYGALIQEAIQQDHDVAALADNNANHDLEEEVDHEEHSSKARREVSSFTPRHFAIRDLNGSSESLSSQNIDEHKDMVSDQTTTSFTFVSPETMPASTALSQRTKTQSKLHTAATSVISGVRTQTARTNTGTPRFRNSTRPTSTKGTVAPSVALYPSLWPTGMSRRTNNTNLGTKLQSVGGASLKGQFKGPFGSQNASNTGTIVANRTHVLLADKKIVEKVNLIKLVVSDKTSRVFHPTQGGHLIIANLILFRMAQQNAKAIGLKDFPPEVYNKTNPAWPRPGGAACNADASPTWAGRDAMISAVNNFCADPRNLKGSKGSLTSGTFSPNSFDYMNVSIRWDENANIGQHSCSAWLDIVTDGCDVPKAGAANLKHGGSIPYNSDVVNATMVIEPLVVRRAWSKGKAGGQRCNPVTTNHYLDQETLQSNVVDYCKQSAAQPGGIANSGSKFSKAFNDGTPDRVELTTEWPLGQRNFQIFQEECEYYMSVLNNGCSLPANNNPMNWKHGGSITDPNGIKYTISPTANRLAPPSSPQGTCDADRHIWGYTWNVYGGGFASGDWGRRLLSEIRGCGAVTKWKFEYGGDLPPGAEWHASGTLPLTISSHCLAKAVRSAGGYESNC